MGHDSFDDLDFFGPSTEGSARRATPRPDPTTDPLADHDAEVAVLGAILMDPSKYHEASLILRGEDFDLPKHATVWEAFTNLATRGDSMGDLRVVVAELRSMNRLNTVGGSQFLGDLTDSIPTGAHIHQHAAIVATLARQRRVRDLFRALAAKASAVNADIDALIARGVSELSTEGTRAAKESSVCAATEAAFALIDRREETMQRRHANPDAWTGIAQPLGMLRPVMGGWRLGEFTVLSAGTSVGKTAFALQTAAVASAAGVHTLIVSLEMDRVELITRVIAERSGVSAEIVSGRADGSSEDMYYFQEGLQAAAALPFTIYDGAQQTVGGILALCHALRARGTNVQMIVMDYLQLLQPETSRKGGTREEEVAAMSRALKVLAKTTGAHVLALSQENDDGRTRESKAIEQNANNIMRLTRDEDPEAGAPCEKMTLHITKQRNGPRNVKIPLLFRRATTSFEDESRAVDELPNNVTPLRRPGPARSYDHDPRFVDGDTGTDDAQ